MEIIEGFPSIDNSFLDKINTPAIDLYVDISTVSNFLPISMHIWKQETKEFPCADQWQKQIVAFVEDKEQLISKNNKQEYKEKNLSTKCKPLKSGIIVKKTEMIVQSQVEMF